MIEKGEKVLASGNLLLWKRLDLGSRGTIEASFRDQPSEADVSEAQAYLRTLVPAGGRSTVEQVGDASEVRRTALEHLAAGLCQN